jgi:hypothetical protein
MKAVQARSRARLDHRADVHVLVADDDREVRQVAAEEESMELGWDDVAGDDDGELARDARGPVGVLDEDDAHASRGEVRRESAGGGSAAAHGDRRRRGIRGVLERRSHPVEDARGIRGGASALLSDDIEPRSRDPGAQSRDEALVHFGDCLENGAWCRHPELQGVRVAPDDGNSRVDS